MSDTKPLLEKSARKTQDTGHPLATHQLGDPFGGPSTNAHAKAFMHRYLPHKLFLTGFNVRKSLTMKKTDLE